MGYRILFELAGYYCNVSKRRTSDSSGFSPNTEKQMRSGDRRPSGFIVLRSLEP